MADFGTAPPPSSRDVAGEDFLFHLYRGSELLQDNRVHEAKSELEHALALQPSDPKGQDLLGIVYFRLGMYPRAIAIYERLVHLHPNAIEPRINLALSYLKTGQPAHARAELEKVLEQSPGHSRAWGYLGLSFKAMGDYERASHAFAAGGHDQMARRLVEMAMATGSVSIRPEAASLLPANAEIRRTSTEAFQEIDKAEGGLRSDIELYRVPRTWSSLEPTGDRPPQLATVARPTTLPSGDGQATVPPADPPPAPALAKAAPPRASEFARQRMLVFPRDLTVSKHPSGLVLIQAPGKFATRLEIVRSMAYPGGWTCETLMRRARGRTIDEPLGGTMSPIVELNGKGEIVLGPAVGQELQPLTIAENEPVYLREDVVAAFDGAIGYENGRLALGDGEAIGMLQLRGPGTAIAQLPERVASIELREGRSVMLRAITVLGWVGRLVPRPLSPSEAPAGVRGYVSLAGEGVVLVDAR